MPKSLLHFPLFLIAVYFFLTCEGASVSDLNPDAMAKRGCSGKLGECPTMGDEEDLVDSESNRRALVMRRRYISYETLRRDLVPCDRPGASYYNCRGPGVANSYSRGCEIITRCARGD